MVLGGSTVSLAINSIAQLVVTAAGLLQFNSGYGSAATAYGCRAWVNFNGTGTVAIRASGNVSSITDTGTGNYTVNFTTAMVDANYSAVCTANVSNYTDAQTAIIESSAAGSCVARTQSYSTGARDTSNVYVSIFR